MYKDISDQYKQEVKIVRQYLENTEVCRRVVVKVLIGDMTEDSSAPHVEVCCDVCNIKKQVV